ncbi:iron-containing alcohol dehydrogenase [Streptomyces sp. NPDC017405]|uniref:iron-containing alcohol dehydrogenase n=1 Tax=unclassified Streptomyces TaxID=2593676 RepID=UPI0037926C57
MGLHHELCHTLGGTFGLPHAETHTVVLPHAMAYNAPRPPTRCAASPTPWTCPTPRAACTT